VLHAQLRRRQQRLLRQRQRERHVLQDRAAEPSRIDRRRSHAQPELLLNLREDDAIGDVRERQHRLRHRDHEDQQDHDGDEDAEGPTTHE
jgi:hypothetical protein